MSQQDNPMTYHPDDASLDVREQSHEQFKEKAEEYGHGKNWRGCGDGEMAQAAIRKLLDAQDHLAKNEREEAITDLAHAWNYIKFEADNAMTFADNSTRTS